MAFEPYPESPFLRRVRGWRLGRMESDAEPLARRMVALILQTQGCAGTRGTRPS